MDFLTLILQVFVLLHPQLAYAQPMMPAVLLEVAQCESGQQQFYPNGKLVRDSVTGKHIGFFQIGLQHEKEATSMGYNIRTEEGNISYALFMYETQGLQPWLASYKDCWGKHFDMQGKPLTGT